MTALYRAYDQRERLLYVGISDEPFTRLGGHVRTHAVWPKYTASVRFEWYDTREEADSAETVAIREEEPVFNFAKRPSVRSLQLQTAYPDGNPDAIDIERVLSGTNDRAPTRDRASAA